MLCARMSYPLGIYIACLEFLKNINCEVLSFIFDAILSFVFFLDLRLVHKTLTLKLVCQCHFLKMAQALQCKVKSH